MRFLLVLCLTCGTAAAQQSVGLVQFLGLTQAQVASVRQLNDLFSGFLSVKNARQNTVQAELLVEYAKTSPNPQALGQRYIELDTIDHEIVVERANVRARVMAILTPPQIALVQQISSALPQQSLILDASCGYLQPAGPVPPGFGNVPIIPAFSTVPVPTFAAFLLGYSPVPTCQPGYPISIRNYLTLTDSQVASILGIQSAYNSFKSRNDNRIADVQVEIRDETAKPILDPQALGIRYAELAQISKENQQADQTGRAAARALLTSDQEAKLQTLAAAFALSVYQLSAESCNFLPPTAGFFFFNFPCQLN